MWYNGDMDKGYGAGEKVYLDYSATTMPDEAVIEKFVEVARGRFENPNQTHAAGKAANFEIEAATKNIAAVLGIREDELIYTSGASESNNTILKGVFWAEEERMGEQRRNEIITSQLEHSSIYGPLGWMQKRGVRVRFAPMNKEGAVDVEGLMKMIGERTLLVSIVAVDSETGIRQPVEEIGRRIHEKFPKMLFHSDITQLLGKDEVDLSEIDLASFSGHKIYGFKGIGGLVKKQRVRLVPLVHGGKSVTKFRSGTPQTELIASMGRSFDLFKDSLAEKKARVVELNTRIREHMKQYPEIMINSSGRALPQVLNFSILGQDANATHEFFDRHGISISTKTACASDSDLSKSILSLTGSEERARSSVRVSLSYRTTDAEVERFLEVLDEYMGAIRSVKGGSGGAK